MGRGVNQVKRLGLRGVIHSVHMRYVRFEELAQKGLLRNLSPHLHHLLQCLTARALGLLGLLVGLQVAVGQGFTGS